MCEQEEYFYKSPSMTSKIQSLLENNDLCDIKLETDDKQIVLAHKVVLASACPYFHAMFTNFAERNHDLVVMGKIDSTALKLLVNFIYSGEIIVTAKNVKNLLPAANFLQLQEVKGACCEFLQSILSPANCIDTNALADLYNCTKLFTTSELYIQHHFIEVINCDEFLSLSFKQVDKLISDDEVAVTSEEKVFECVIRWVKHELVSRQCELPLLMGHVRLPLISKHYISGKVMKEPLIENCLKCKDYIIEALHFLGHTSDDLIPQNIRNKPRHGSRVILVVGEFRNRRLLNPKQWYDPKLNLWHYGPEMLTYRYKACLVAMNDNLLFTVGGRSLRSIHVLNLSSKSPCWNTSVRMLTKRGYLGVGVINNYLYAVGGMNEIDGFLNSAEVFDNSIQVWRMISSMSTGRADFGIGVLNNLLYAVGGCNSKSANSLNTVECYHPSLDIWTPVAEMSVQRRGVRVGVLDGVLYAVGGLKVSESLRSVEAYRPSTGVWTSIADMHFPRSRAGVVVLNGLLYVFGGYNEFCSLDSVECYCPNTNKWSIVTTSMPVAQTLAGAVAIKRTHCNIF